MHHLQSRMPTLLLFFSVLLTASCAHNNSVLQTTPTVVKTSIFPPDAIELDDNYRDWFGPTLVELKEGPLWVSQSTPPDAETIRFTFIPGAMRIKGQHATVIRIDLKESSARLIARSQFNNRGNRTIKEVANRSLSAEKIAKLQDLADKADAWKFRVGTWEEADTISIHCTELIMERRQPSGYAVSHIRISCNNPNRLMPLVNYIAQLAGQNRKKLRY